MNNANIGWLFYKEMYKLGDSDEQIAHTLNKILKIKAVDKSMNAKESFKCKTLYPGLLIGSGYTHGLSSDSDVKIGFYFDHTTGLPLIQGSSVKGMLRSCFGFPIKGQTDKYMDEKHQLIRDLLQKPEIDVTALAKEIFEGIDPETAKAKSIYERDIFYEARVIEDKERKEANDKKYLLSEDYITPHGENLCEEPRPLKFIKVSPEIIFEFSFDLKDTTLATAEEKKELFMELTEMFGIGAKTNVGYGQFELVLTDEEKEEKEKQEQIRERKRKAKEKDEAKEQENMGLSEFEIFIKELEEFKKKDNNMVKKIKEYEGEIEDIERVKEVVNSKKGADKFHKRIMNHLDSLN